VHGQHDTIIQKLEDPDIVEAALNAKVHDEKALLDSPGALTQKDKSLTAAIEFQKE
jgi:hypothetical protein